MNQPQIYLIDGTAYVYRAYHAIRNLSNSQGLPTNAVFGFTRMLISLIKERNPDYAGMFFDARGKTFRHEMFDQYKANRPPMPDDMAAQLKHIKSVTQGFKLPIVELEGYEADDLIGTVARKAERAGYEVVIVTGDKDFVQLLSKHTRLWDPMKSKDIDLTGFRDEFQIDPQQMIDVMGLSGDTADNVPGVPGIGPKTAMTLIRTFDTLDGIYERLDELKKKKKQHENLTNFKEQAYLSRKLVTIDTDAPIAVDLENFRLQEPDNNHLAQLFRELEFNQLQKTYFDTTDEAPKKSYNLITDASDLRALVKKLEKASLIAIDTETTAIDPMRARLVGISVSMEPHKAYYIPCGHDYLGAPKQLTLSEIMAAIGDVLKNPQIHKVGQNIKYDWTVLRRHGIALQGIVFDTMVASYLLNPSKRAHNLDQIALDFLDHKNMTYAEVAGKGKKSLGFNAVLLEKAVPYACEDADITLMAYEVLQPKLEAADLIPLFESVEMPLVEVLLRMEMTGICVDQNRLRDLSKGFEKELGELETRIYELAGESFNVKSSQQLGRILFEKLELPVQKKTRKTKGYSTDVEVLTTLAGMHELPALVLRHRTLAKLKTTYADALLELIHPDTGRIHTSFNQTVAATGRLSSSDPNLQNIPIRTPEGRLIRSAFIPRPGWTLVSADYSQIELRLLAHCSKDEVLIQAFVDDEDIHTRTAAEVFQVPPDEVTNELRQQAKVINFGIIYGMGAFSLARELDISQKMAATYIKHYFERYPGVKSFVDETIDSVRQTRRTSTLLGRIRQLPDINSRNHNVRAFAERTAVNTPIQGSAADLIKVAMIRADRAIRDQGLQTAMLLSVHDEIIFEVPPEEMERVQELVPEIMEQVWQLAVPLKVNVSYGDNWAEAH